MQNDGAGLIANHQPFSTEELFARFDRGKGSAHYLLILYSIAIGIKAKVIVDIGTGQTTGALRAEPRRPKCHDLVVQLASQHVLHAHRRPVRDHRPHVIQPRPKHDRHQCCDQWDDQRRGGFGTEQSGEKLAEEGEPSDPDGQSQ